MGEIFQQFLANIGGYLPKALAALGILVGGWLVAVIAAALLRGVISRTGLDRKLAKLFGQDEDEGVKVSRWVARLVYYLIILFVLVAFLNTLNLTMVGEPIQQLLSSILGYLPAIFGAGLLLLVAWLLATLVRLLITRALKVFNLDERLSKTADVAMDKKDTIGSTIGNVAYWLVFLFFLPAVFNALNVRLAGVEEIVSRILGALPNLLSAAVVLLFGWLAARIIRQIVVNLLSGVGVDRFAERIGIEKALGERKLSGIIGVVVYVFIFIPVLIGALQTLNVPALTDPASAMLTLVLAALPAIFGALLLLAIAYFVARWVGGFVSTTLAGIGFDNVLSWIGLGKGEYAGKQTPSQIVGYLANLAVMLFAVIEAARMLGFASFSDLVGEFLVASGGVLLGLVIFGIGMYLADVAARVIRSAAGANSALLANVARVAIIVFAGALALRQTGIAQDIVNIGFGLVVGAFAVAAAIAFGLGGRDIAAREIDKALENLRKK